MILDLDFGNTRLKWRVTDGLTPVSTSAAVAVTKSTVLPPIDVPKYVSRIRVATVRGPAVEAALVSWAREQFGIAPEFARSTTSTAGVINGYTHPEQLGVDRWLAVLAACADGGAPAVVFDFGSAITVDAVRGDGLHLGGCIAPGLVMMQKALFEGTDLVRSRLGTPHGISAGRNTSDAVCSGVLAAAAGFANESWWRLRECTDATFATITGGDAQLVASLLSFPFVHKPDLVLEGLNVALP